MYMIIGQTFSGIKKDFSFLIIYMLIRLILHDIKWIHIFVECPLGTYGPYCAHKCSGHCLGSVACNRTTGNCDTGCDFGYTREICKTAVLKSNVDLNMQWSWQAHFFVRWIEICTMHNFTIRKSIDYLIII